MKLENQVCTLEQAKRLKELGITQESAFYHYEAFVNGDRFFMVSPLLNFEYCEMIDNDMIKSALEGESKNEIYSAFTVAELGSLLPYTVGYGYVDAELSLRKDLEWSARYEHEYNTEGGYGAAVREVWNNLEYSSDNAAQALATLLIHVLEKELATASDCNARLLNS